MASSRSLGTLTLDLIAKIGGFIEGMDKAARAADKRSKEIQASAAKIGTAFGVAVTAVGSATVALVKHTINQADALGKAAQAAGITAESLSSLRYAAEMGGTSQDQLFDALTRLNKGMSDAVRGTGEATKALRDMDLSVTDANGNLKSADEMLAEVAEKFAGYKDGAEKSALAVALFGREGAKMIPFLNSGRAGLKDAADEAKRLGLIIGDQTASEAARFNDEMAKLGKTIEGLKTSIALSALPALNDLISRLQAAASASDTFLKSLMGWATVSGNDERDPASAVKRISGELARLKKMRDELDPDKSLANKLNDWVFGDAGDLDKQIAVQEARLAYVQRLHDQVVNRDMTALWGATSKPAAPHPTVAITANTKPPRDAVQELLDGIQKDIERFGRNDVQIKLLEAYDAGASNEQMKAVYDLATALQKLKDNQAAAEKSAEEAARVQEQMAQVYQSTRTPLEALSIELERLAKLRDAGMAWDTHARAVNKALDGYDALGKKIEETITVADEFALEAARNIQSHLGDALFNILDGKFDDIGKSFVKMLKRMAAEAMAADLARSMFGDYAKTGKAGGWLGSAITAIGSLFGGGRAIGGPVSGGRIYEVGEGNRPELLALGGRQYLIPGNEGRVTPGAGGGVTIHQTNNFSSNVDRAQMASFAQRIKADTIAEIRQANLTGDSALVGL